MGERFNRMGDQFLDQPLAFEGFSLDQPYPTSNSIGETLLVDDGSGRMTHLAAALLQVADLGAAAKVATPSPTLFEEPPVEECAVEIAEEEPPQEEPPVATEPEPSAQVRRHSPIPAVRVWAIEQVIEDLDHLDSFVADHINELCGCVAESFPAFTRPQEGCCYRWARRTDSGRTMVVCTLGSSAGILERASACLHPLEEEDEIVILAPELPSDQRRAARSFMAGARLFELSRTPDNSPPALLLKDVSAEC